MPTLFEPAILLHFEGPNGATTFPDSSPFNHLVISSGSGCSLTTGASVFGTGSLSAAATNQNSYAYTPITSGSALDINSTTADFTVEFWVQQTELGSGASNIFSFNNGGSYDNFRWEMTYATEWTMQWGPNSGGNLAANKNYNFNYGVWYAIAIVRYQGIITVYINGVAQTGSGAQISCGATTFNCANLWIGDAYVGGSGNFYPTYVDEFRVTQGSALYTGSTYTVSTTGFTYIGPLTSSNGDITDPYAWQDAAGTVPPTEFSNVPYNTNYPLNGDGRYWWEGNATSTTGGTIGFIGGSNYLTDTASLQWSIVQSASDGSSPVLYYCTEGGLYTAVPIGSAGTTQGVINESGQVQVSLTSASVLYIAIQSSGGTATTGATPWQVALAITRNANEKITWDYPDPFDPVGYNGLVVDNNVPTDTMADLSYRLLVRLGFASQAANPPPGMASLVQDFLTSAQTFLYRRYLQLHTKRLFRWKVNPGQRYYSLHDNDENVLEGVNMDYAKTVEWAGIQDSRNVWYPLIQGIPPQLYTMITKPWRPARYEIRGSIELYPAPDQTYWMWMKGHFGLMPFTLSTHSTTIDSELVFLHALANAKAHYGQPDANNIEAQANAYRMELIAATHQTAHYVPGTIAVPPAVRPTLIQFDGGGGGS